MGGSLSEKHDNQDGLRTSVHRQPGPKIHISCPNRVRVPGCLSDSVQPPLVGRHVVAAPAVHEEAGAAPGVGEEWKGASGRWGKNPRWNRTPTRLLRVEDSPTESLIEPFFFMISTT